MWDRTVRLYPNHAAVFSRLRTFSCRQGAQLRVRHPCRFSSLAVDVTPGDAFQAGRPAPLIDPWTFSFTAVRGYDVFPDGSFVIAVTDDDRSQLEQFGVTEFHVILNFFEELKERVPVN